MGEVLRALAAAYVWRAGVGETVEGVREEDVVTVRWRVAGEGSIRCAGLSLDGGSCARGKRRSERRTDRGGIGEVGLFTADDVTFVLAGFFGGYCGGFVGSAFLGSCGVARNGERHDGGAEISGDGRSVLISVELITRNRDVVDKGKTCRLETRMCERLVMFLLSALGMRALFVSWKNVDTATKGANRVAKSRYSPTQNTLSPSSV